MLPPRTKMWLTVSCCTGLKRLKAKDMPITQAELDELRQQQETARQALNAAFLEAGANMNADNLPRVQRRVNRATNALAEIDARLRAVPEDEDDGTNTEILPNPFVIVTIDDDDENDTHPMICTNAVRESVNPVWKDKNENVPLEMYLTGKRAYEMFQNQDKDYEAKALTFSVYHDDGVPDSKGPEPSDDEWKREKPRRTKLIGVGKWAFSDIRTKIGCPEFEKELDVFEPCGGKKIKNACLTIKVRLCAPKMKHCACLVAKVNCDDDVACSDSDSTPSVPRKVVRVQKQRQIHGDNCFCAECRCVSFQKPKRRIARRVFI